MPIKVILLLGIYPKGIIRNLENIFFIKLVIITFIIARKLEIKFKLKTNGL